MDRQLTDYIAALLAHSPQLEKAFDLARRNVVRDLELLGTLEGVARHSLLPWIQERAAETQVPSEETAALTAPSAQAVQATQTASAAPPTQVRRAASGKVPAPAFDSQRTEYKPALRDRELVDALLEFHRRNLPARAGKHTARGTAESTFSAAALPEIEAERKTAPASWQKTPGIYQPILRTPKPKVRT